MRPKLTYANVVATLALFIAVGGATAFAASKLAKNSVGTKQIKNEAVTARKIKKGTITGAQVNLGSLGTVPNATNAGNANHASTATNSESLGGFRANQFVQGDGTSLAARTTLELGGGGFQHILTVPSFGEVVGGCGTGGAAVGFTNHAGHSLRVYQFASTDHPPETIADGASSELFPTGAGASGMNVLQIGSTNFKDQSLLTVIVTRDAEVSNECKVQASAITN